MTAEADIHDMLIDRDITAFVAADWAAVEPDFDAAQFTGYSAEFGQLRLEFATLAAYRDSWLAQADGLSGQDVQAQIEALHAVQRLDRIEIVSDRALVVKVFDGELIDNAGNPQTLAWTTFYFLRFDSDLERWLITGFVGYIPAGEALG